MSDREDFIVVDLRLKREFLFAAKMMEAREDWIMFIEKVKGRYDNKLYQIFMRYAGKQEDLRNTGWSVGIWAYRHAWEAQLALESYRNLFRSYLAENFDNIKAGRYDHTLQIGGEKDVY